MDPVTTEIVRTKFASLIDEMNFLLARSAYSSLMRESRDCSFGMLDRDGRLVISPSSFSHGVVYQGLVKGVLQEYGSDGVSPGDIFIGNHPYECNTLHIPDLGVVVPVFVKGELVAFSGTVAHKPDFGGSMPGSGFSGAVELIQEGLLLPLIRYARRGKVTNEITRIIRANVRNPDLVMGDMASQLGVSTAGAARIRELFERFGVRTIAQCFDAMLDGSEQMLHEVLRQWPDGTEEIEGYLDDNGTGDSDPVRLHVAITKTGTTIDFDFRQCDPQVRGPFNIPRTRAESACFHSLKSTVEQELPFNDGLRRPVTMQFQEGTVVCPRPPAPVGSSTFASHKVVDLLMEALGRFQPTRAVAQSGGSGGSLAAAWAPGIVGRYTYTHYELFGSAAGATSISDGESGITVNWGSNLRLTPIEVTETACPLRTLRFELIPDSGGAGRYRGGLSYRRVYQLLKPATINRRADRVKFPAPGAHGGHTGRAGAFVLFPDTDKERRAPGSGMYQLQEGDTFAIEPAGGGGFGDPLERDPELVLADVLAGYVTEEGAQRDYGVVIRDQQIDSEATSLLREHCASLLGASSA